MLKRQSAAMLAEPDTEPIPVYRELSDTQPLPVYRETTLLTHPQIRPELHRQPEPAPRKAKPAKGKAKPLSPRAVQVIMLIISILIAALLYQIPFIGHY